MLIVVPSRGRPDSLRRMLKSFADTETRCKVLIRIDDDDESMNGCDAFSPYNFPMNVRCIVGEQVKSVGAMNEAIKMYPDEDCYALLGDDCVAKTLHWDEILRETAGDWHIAFPDDLLKGGTLAAHPVVGAKFIKAVGFWALPGLIHLYQDKVIDTLGRMYGNLIYRSDVVVEHLHFSVGKSPMDDTYRRTFKGRPHAQHDHDVYETWLASYVKDPALAEKIKAEAERKNLPVSDGSKPVTFVCLNAGNYCGRGAEYVNVLYDSVVRNMPPGRAFRFVCLTDNAAGLHKEIETLPLPADLAGWWGKLYFFKRGLFAEGERIIFMDLDTLIIGKLDDLVAYDGDFATLTDFYFPQQVGPAIIAWQAGGLASTIWDEWVAEGRPANPMGDLWWINNLDQGRFARKCDKLQTLFPGTFVSFKAHCKPNPPKGAKVVCFHGLPRPHEASPEWVSMCWRVGGMVPADLDCVANTGTLEVAKNVAAACKLPLPWLPFEKPHDGEIAIVGGGPSLPRFLDEIRELVAAGMGIVATNGTHDYLTANGIIPDVHLIIDARSENARFITKPAKAYWLASQCHPVLFELAGDRATVIHMHTEGVLDSIPPSIKPLNLISTGSTVVLAGMGIAYCLGYRKIRVYGMDSSYEDSRHAYPQDLNDADKVIEAVVGGRAFRCAPWMVAQAQHFQTLAAELAADGCEISVRCGGLLAHVATLMMRNDGIPAQHAA